jgi:hypothetical protein
MVADDIFKMLLYIKGDVDMDGDILLSHRFAYVHITTGMILVMRTQKKVIKSGII